LESGIRLHEPAAAGDGRVRSGETETPESHLPGVERAQEDAGAQSAEPTIESSALDSDTAAAAHLGVARLAPAGRPTWSIEDFDAPEWIAGDAVSDRSDWEPDDEMPQPPDSLDEEPESFEEPTGDVSTVEDVDKVDEIEEIEDIEDAIAALGDLEPEDDDGAPLPEEPEEAPPASISTWEDDDAADEVPDFTRFTSEEYAQASTREYANLAEAVAKAAGESHEPMAVAAGMPGVEAGIVGLDDMVTAGMESAGDESVIRASDLPRRILTGLLLGAVFLASLTHPLAIGLLILVVLGLAVGELFTVLVRSGRHPLALFGFLGVGGAFIGTWAGNLVAVPVALLTATIAVLFFYAVVPGRSKPLENAALTVLAVAWIGGLGAFAFDILDSPHYRWLIGALVVTVALMDSASYFVGRRIGRRPLAPVVSPKKTVEGLVGGVIVALAAGAGFGMFEPFDLVNGLVLGAVVALIAPFGDLAVSVIKRSLGIKDMGTILPGHGGVLDRIDAVLFVIPAAWMAYAWMGLLA
jgi:phosphatidate cytidylyltransferase